MICVFVQLRCAPGETCAASDAIWARDVVSEFGSTSGDVDLSMKIHSPDGEDAGKVINANLADRPGIGRSRTTLTFRAFRAPERKPAAGLRPAPRSAAPAGWDAGGALTACRACLRCHSP